MPRKATKAEKNERFYRGFKALKDNGVIKKSDLVLRERVTSKYPADKKEAQVLKEIISELKKNRITHKRLTVGKFYTGWGSTVSVGKKGESDLEIIMDGKVIYMEVKAGKGGYLSESQIKFREERTRQGFTYLTACSAQEAIDKLQPYMPKEDLF